MRKIGNRIAVLLVIFILSSVIFFVLAGEEGTESETQEMSEATFPVLFFTCAGEEVNESFGYAQKMDVSTIRDTITPVDEDLTIPVTIDVYDNEIISIAYNIYDPETAEVIEAHTAAAIEVTDEEASDNLILYNTLDSGSEAVLEVVLDLGDAGELYYYTRLTMQEDAAVTLGMSFVKTFHEETLSGSDGSSLTSYLETDSDTEYTTLSHVTIESDVSLVMWDALEPVLSSEVSLDIAEVNESYQAYTMTYLVSSALTGSTYYVEEYFRIRIVSAQAYLLDYDRTAEQIFAAVENAVSEETLQLGIRDEDITYQSNTDGSILAFVQAGELWEYHADSAQLIRVYGYLDTDQSGSADTDFRDLNMDHEIRICSMDDSGNLYFMLCGYRSRGAHEGENGVSLFYYDAINQTVEEKIFLTSDSAYQVLKEEIGDLSYVNSDGCYCMVYGNTLYMIYPDTLSTQELASGIDPDYFIISESGRYAAFLYEDDDGLSEALSVIDLNTGEITQISGNGGYVRPLGYLGENLIYGIAAADDVATDDAGNVTFAMNTLVILNTDLSTAKEYDEGSYYVTDTQIEDGTVRLTRVTKSGSGYEEADDDTIIDFDSLNDQAAAVSSAVDAAGEQQIVITMSVSADADIELCIPQVTVTEGLEETSLLQEVGELHAWRVYYRQKLIYAGNTLGEAITLADETAAVVTDSAGVPVWRRNNDSSGSVSDLTAWTDASDSETASLACALSSDGVSESSILTALSDTDSVETVPETLLPGAEFLDLSGCTAEEVLYYTAQGRPVLAKIGSETVVIKGYSSGTVTVYNPLTDSTSYYTTSGLEELCEEAGNIFYTWLL